MAWVAISAWFPDQLPSSSSPSYQSNVIDAAGEKFAWVGPMWNRDRTTKSIHKAGFRFGTITKAGGSGLTLSLQDVSATSGPIFQPDGTPDQTVAISNANIPASNSWFLTDAFSADRSVAFGEMVALVMEFDGSGWLGADAINVTNYSNSGFLNNHSGGIPYTTSWLAGSAAPNVIFEFSDGTFGTIEGGFPSSAMNTYTFNSGSTPDERAMKISIPAPCKIDGIALTCTPSANFDVVLYDAADSVVVTVSIDANQVRAASAGPSAFPIAETTLAPGTYRLSVKPTSGSNVSVFGYDVSSASHWQVRPSPTDWQMSTRTNAGAWTDTTTTRFDVALRISAVQYGVEPAFGLGI